MNEKTLNNLEYYKIIETLKEFAHSSLGKRRVEKLRPQINLEGIKMQIQETTQAKAILNKKSRVPLNGLDGFEKVYVKIGKNNCLNPEDFTAIGELLSGVRQMKTFMREMEVVAPIVSGYVYSMADLSGLQNEILNSIGNGRVLDKASPTLNKIRKKKNVVEERIKAKLQSFLTSSIHSPHLQEKIISTREGRYVIPVKQQYKNSFEGNVLDSSRTGSTLFVEPEAVKRLHDELNTLRVEEEKELYIILSKLTVQVEMHQQEIKIIVETLETYDFLFAKARYSQSIKGNPIYINDCNKINIKEGRHPLLGDEAVPLDFTIGDTFRSLIITGPNTGGKTVVLKTIGLLTLMAQAGLHVPASEDSQLSVFLDVLTDIGDGQSIEQSLSTFSSHIRNIIGILGCAEKDTLILIDEVGTGTDPSEGSGLAMAILEELHNSGATTVATTHYSEIKTFAQEHPGFENGSMGFDISTLKPLYKLSIGVAGESNGFLIALRLGMKKELVRRAHNLIYKEDREYDIEFEESNPIEDEIIKSHMDLVNSKNKQQLYKKQVDKVTIEHSFDLGDSVYIPTMDRTGIICELENSKGDLGVMIMKKKFKINKKRLRLHIEAKELYPEGYDLDIVFKSKENRKLDHDMNRKYTGDTIRIIKEGKEN
ncbi:hypothetical protein HYG86_11105 [Alkalicella caledoniensis]|uniref:Uncharacterized protein n=1 Tax=Alkalicella caledoniensis TaxID=2731377 RepID=A0A7G9W9A8_ALKCA|nr:endonuclease MutS2 [Alkalicella caledoniensis]QNO15270.1 hypothetical protein HYG86_11105 [Alkalicella caledoniensis]